MRQASTVTIRAADREAYATCAQPRKPGAAFIAMIAVTLRDFGADRHA
jgi:hypothetical protein